MPQLTPEELDQIRNSLATATDEVVIAMIKAVLSGGIDKVHPDVLRICADEINARGISSQMMGENIMRTTIPRLRKTIRKAIVEAKNNRYNHVSPGGVQIQHGDLDGAPTDFHDYGAVAHRMISKGVWPKMTVDLRNAGDWDFYDCGDGYRFIHDCLACVDDEGRVMFAIYCRDRANSYNATSTDYDCYVLDCHVIEQNSRGTNPSSGWSRWASKGEYCVNTQQIVDTLEEALETYVQMVTGQ